MAFKVYPQPPFKKFVKTKSGYIVEVKPYSRIEPAVYSKNGYPLTRFGYEISWGATMVDKDGKVTGFIDLVDVIVADSDTKEEML